MGQISGSVTRSAKGTVEEDGVLKGHRETTIVIARSERDEAIHVSAGGEMDCFAEPVIGAVRADPLACNDELRHLINISNSDEGARPASPRHDVPEPCTFAPLLK